MKLKKKSFIGSMFVIVAGMMWGTTGLFVKYFTDLGLDSIQISVIKIAVASLILLIYCLIFKRSALKIKLKDIWIFAASGIVSLDAFTYCYFTTLQESTMSVAAVLLYLAPVFVMIMSTLLFKEKLTGKKISACVLAFLGCLLVSGLIGSGTSISSKALVFGVLSGFGYALYSIFSELAFRKGYSALTVTTYTFMFALLGMIFLIDPTQIYSAASTATPAIFILMAIFDSVWISLLPYIFYTNGLARTTPSKAAIIASIEPITATVVGALALSQFPDIFGFLGIFCVLFAIVILNVKFKKHSKRKQ